MLRAVHNEVTRKTVNCRMCFVVRRVRKRSWKQKHNKKIVETDMDIWNVYMAYDIWHAYKKQLLESGRNSAT